jgi:hypothetical protein
MDTDLIGTEDFEELELSSTFTDKIINIIKQKSEKL